MSKSNPAAPSGANDPCGQNKDIMLPCKKELKSEKILLQGAAEAAKKVKETFEANRNNKVCYMLKADETARLYRNIDIYVAIDANTRAETIEKNIDDLVKKSSDLEKAISEAVKCIKTIKHKAAELKAKACDLDTQTKDSCNQQQLTILDAHFSEKCKVSAPGGTGDFFDFKAIVAHVLTKTGEIYKNADTAFNSAVSIAGIQTFSNVKSLKEMSKQMTLCIKDFKKDVDTNVKTGDDELKKAQEELAKSVKEVSLKTMEEHKESVKYEGVAFTLDFVCDPGCEDCGDKDITEICCKVMNTFCGEGEECGCGQKDKKQYSYQNID